MTNSDDSMVEILRATMRNDAQMYKVYESFNTRHKNVDGIYIPCKFIKIVPLWYSFFLIFTPIYNRLTAW
jgi:Muskelin N-terminus